jgi:hypothetical protein
VAYFTNTADVAYTYARSMARKSGGDRIVYKVDLLIDKCFDVDNYIPSSNIKKMFSTRSEMESFARGAGLLSSGADKYLVLGQLSDGALTLTGEQVFKGISQGMTQTARARELLKRLGYDSLRYNGGSNMGTALHDVYISYYANRIRIIDRFMFDAQGNRYEMKSATIH